MQRYIFSVLIFCIASPALAQEPRGEPRGCDKFEWALDKERALLTSPDVPKVSAGAELQGLPSTAIAISLVPFEAAKLPMPPERLPKSSSSLAGFVRIAAVAKAGTYRVTLSTEGWLDVIQGGHYLKVKGFTGAIECTGVRKSVKFELAAAPLVIQVTGVNAPATNMVITAGE